MKCKSYYLYVKGNLIYLFVCTTKQFDIFVQCLVNGLPNLYKL